MHALGFTLDEVREARLAPLVNFKGRSAGSTGDAMDAHGQAHDE